MGALVAAAVGVPALYLQLATIPGGSGMAETDLTPAKVADQLAVAVRAQWEAEAAMRRLDDPWPLPVSWVPADPALTDSWDLLLRLATAGASRSSLPARPWAAGPARLAGSGHGLAEVLALVPTGRLVVLGEPGSGKTMLVIRMVLELLAKRPPGGQVPFLASVASWNPSAQGLREWLTSQMITDHPMLAAAPSPGTEEPTIAGALLSAGLIIPVLDGLDEIPATVRGSAIARINDALRPGDFLVVTCRTQQYREAVSPPSAAEVTLRGAAAVQLRSLDEGVVRSYLSDDAGGQVTRARWDPVLAALGTTAPVSQALVTPLMVGLARTVYNARPGEPGRGGVLRDPAELCTPALADRAAVEALLFDQFVPAAYRNESGDRWSTERAERWLVFLARHLERTVASPDLSPIQLPLAVPRFAVIFGIVSGILAGLATWVAVIAVGGSAAFPVAVPPPLIAAAAAVYVMIMNIPGASQLSQRMTSARWSLGAASPSTALARYRLVSLLVPFPFLPFVLAAALVALSPGTSSRQWVAAAFVVSLPLAATSPFLSMWPGYLVAKAWLAAHRQLPWSLMPFLDDAHRRGVLRQAGTVYQFRHIELQHRLANRPSESVQPGTPGSEQGSAGQERPALGDEA